MSKRTVFVVVGGIVLAALLFAIAQKSSEERESGAFACEDASIKSVMAEIVVEAGKAPEGSEITEVTSTRDGNAIACQGMLAGKPISYQITFVPEDQRDTVPNRDGILPESVSYDGWRHERPKN